MTSEADTQTDRHTHTHTDMQTKNNDFKKPGAQGLWPHTPRLKTVKFTFLKSMYIYVRSSCNKLFEHKMTKA